MALYRKKSPTVDAVQWFKMGDHGPVQPYPYVAVPICVGCKRPMPEHGFLADIQRRVCPGDFIVTGKSGKPYPVRPAEFEALYELVEGGE